MNTQSGPRGWSPGKAETRFADSKPTSFNADARTVECVISMGSPVTRFYGTECLRISPEAVDLSRMENGSMIPLLDSHQAGGINNALGRFQKIWFNRGALMGQIRFNETANGTMAMGMVERGEIAGISAGYCVECWEIKDSEGRVIDPEVERIRWDEDGLIFTACSWSLHEGSLVSVPADQHSSIRSFGTGLDRAAFVGTINRANDVLARMQCRQRMHERSAAYHDRRAVLGNTDRPAGTAWRRASSVFP
jgi:phage head maturation protease